jgi:hypothetical protein
MAFSGESILDPAVLGEALAQETPTNQAPTDQTLTNRALTNQALAIDMPTRDTLTKADRLDVTYFPVAVAMIVEAPAEPMAVPETKPDANATAGLQRSAALHVHRTSVMLPRPRPKIGPAKTSPIKISHLAKPVVEVKTCTPPEGLSGLLMALANQPRCG